jgi:hypothetical protein
LTVSSDSTLISAAMTIWPLRGRPGRCRAPIRASSRGCASRHVDLPGALLRQRIGLDLVTGAGHAPRTAAGDPRRRPIGGLSDDATLKLPALAQPMSACGQARRPLARDRLGLDGAFAFEGLLGLAQARASIARSARPLRHPVTSSVTQPLAFGASASAAS